MITSGALLMAAALGVATQPTPAIIHEQSTEQMYRNYMESGSIYYGNHSDGPPDHIVKQTDQLLLPAIEHEAQRFAFDQKTAGR